MTGGPGDVQHAVPLKVFGADHGLKVNSCVCMYHYIIILATCMRSCKTFSYVRPDVRSARHAACSYTDHVYEAIIRT